MPRIRTVMVVMKECSPAEHYDRKEGTGRRSACGWQGYKKVLPRASGVGGLMVGTLRFESGLDLLVKTN